MLDQMSGCLDQLSCHCNMEWEGKRNAIASISAATLFFSGWWLMLDTAAVYEKKDWSNVYIIITVASSLAMFMVNAISNSQVRGEALHESILGTKGARLWLMFGFVVSFSALVAATWILFSDYVLRPGDHTVWPGVSLFIHNAMIFAASLVYKFGRTEDLWG